MNVQPRRDGLTMPASTAEPVLVVSPRYADEVAASVTETGMVPRVERRAERAAERFAAEPFRLVVVDARGALAAGLDVARALGRDVEQRRGGLLVLLSRVDSGATGAAHDAGATGVLVSPFGSAAFGNALRLTARHARRLDDAAARLAGNGADDARHDTLTGLATGDQLQQWVTSQMALPERPQTMFALAIGVGRFAQINAAYGRTVADRVLSAVALRLSQIVDAPAPGRSYPGAEPETRLLARLAAAEFAIALAGPVILADAMRLATAVRGAFERPFIVGDHVIHLSGRIGIAASLDEEVGSSEQDAAALIRRASSALAQARTGDAGTIEVFRPEPGGDPLTRLADLESDLHDAMRNDDILVVFQPQLALASGKITGVEALVRWEHPVLGLLPAETLLETAAAAELAIALGRHIRLRAMEVAVRWTGALARLKLSVNVTPADLADPGFTAALEASLAETGLPRNRLILEVTEGALIDDMSGAAQLLSALRATGVRIALDDFGTGFSSLAWMARLPIDAIKLDRSFTLGLTGAPRERVVVETVVRLSKQLGLTVVAEGVEDESQLEAARLAGCDAVQGYRVAVPMPAAALEAFCEDWHVAEPA